MSELNTVHFEQRWVRVAVWGQVASGVKLNFQAVAAPHGPVQGPGMGQRINQPLYNIQNNKY